MLKMKLLELNFSSLMREKIELMTLLVSRLSDRQTCAEGVVIKLEALLPGPSFRSVQHHGFKGLILSNCPNLYFNALTSARAQRSPTSE